MTGRYNKWGTDAYGRGRYDNDDDDGGGFGGSSRTANASRGGRGASGQTNYYSSSTQSMPTSRSRDAGGRWDSRDSGMDRRAAPRPGYDSRDSGMGYDRRGGTSSLPLSGGGGSRYDGYSGGGRGAQGYNDTGQDEYQERIQAANRRMEESSGNSLRVLHETERMGVSTTYELEEQAEKLDRVERRLDEMDVDLEESKRHMRNIKSPFGGIANYFARRRKIEEVTDPKMPKTSAVAAEKQRGRDPKGKDGDGSGSTGRSSVGNKVVDDNLDEMEKVLHRLRGIGELIGEQLDDSDAQIERVGVKMDRTDVKMKRVNKDIKRQL